MPHVTKHTDCDSGDDEKSCKLDEKPVKRACANDEYQCKDGRCILVSKFIEFPLNTFKIAQFNRLI